MDVWLQNTAPENMVHLSEKLIKYLFSAGQFAQDLLIHLPRLISLVLRICAWLWLQVISSWVVCKCPSVRLSVGSKDTSRIMKPIDFQFAHYVGRTLSPYGLVNGQNPCTGIPTIMFTTCTGQSVRGAMQKSDSQKIFFCFLCIFF